MQQLKKPIIPIEIGRNGDEGIEDLESSSEKS